MRDKNYQALNVTDAGELTLALGMLIECRTCDDGNSYSYIITCPVCNGAKTFKKGTRNYKCKKCTGQGYISNPNGKTCIGPCPSCDGTRKTPLTVFDRMTPLDSEFIFKNFFDFETPYSNGYNTFNEEYLGFGLVAGVTDYGRYKTMSDEEFKTEVKRNFVQRCNQYIHLMDRTKTKFLKSVQIRKHDSGWVAYPIF